MTSAMGKKASRWRAASGPTGPLAFPAGLQLTSTTFWRLAESPCLCRGTRLARASKSFWKI